jgi:hypothetical protein
MKGYDHTEANDKDLDRVEVKRGSTRFKVAAQAESIEEALETTPATSTTVSTRVWA